MVWRPASRGGADVDVLVTGGAGYIGSTVVSALADAGHHPVVLDDLSTGRAEFVRGRTFYRGDIADAGLVRRIVARHPGIRTAVHCAARVVVPESVARPADYYRTNVTGTLELAEALSGCGVHDLVVSGSASVYGAGPDLAVDEDAPWAPASPYARTKAVAEQMLADLAAAGRLRVLSLRYFNPVGADPWLRTGPQQPRPGHVLGVLADCRRTGAVFPVRGTDYPTRDGSALRDYVHVWDLARAHVAAVEHFVRALDGRRAQAINLGTGRGTTVRELVATFARVSGHPVTVADAPRRPGDTAGAFARTDRAARLLGWHAERDLATGVADLLGWLDRRPAVLAGISADPVGSPGFPGSTR